MARKKLTPAEERAIAELVERELDDDRRKLVKREGGSRSDATAVLSVRLPIDDVRHLRELAAARGVTLSTLLHDALGMIATSWTARMSVSRRTSRLHVEGASLSTPWESAQTYSLAEDAHIDRVLTTA